MQRLLSKFQDTRYKQIPNHKHQTTKEINLDQGQGSGLGRWY